MMKMLNTSASMLLGRQMIKNMAINMVIGILCFVFVILSFITLAEAMDYYRDYNLITYIFGSDRGRNLSCYSGGCYRKLLLYKRGNY